MLIAAYLIEAGLLLAMAPWTALWERNFFASLLPWLGDWMASGYVRGGVTGIGLVTTVVGLRELAGSFLRRSAVEPARDESA
ncbi:MAG TPA: hypothetical protein VMM93_15075 [Vicinamibacterales bacterium]|nr:hypothetical protein [Vicinamibacterales bacterium]